MKKIKLVVANNKGGTGKTFLSFHIARALVDFYGQKDVLYWDTDVVQTDGTKWALGLDEEELKKRIEFDKIYKKDGLYVVAGNKVPKWNGLMVIDTDPDCKAMADAIRIADKLLVPFKGTFAIEDAEKVIKAWRKMKKGYIMGILNEVLPTVRLGIKEYQRARKVGIDLYSYGLRVYPVVRMAEHKKVPFWKIPMAKRTTGIEIIIGITGELFEI